MALRMFHYDGELNPRALYNFLDENKTGKVSKDEFFLLSAFNKKARTGVVPKLKTFLGEKFGTCRQAFKVLYGDLEDMAAIAESKLPRVEWENASVSVYKGREWLRT